MVFQLRPPDAFLVPPNGATPNAGSEINLQLGKARLQKKSQSTCVIDAGTFHLSFQKSKALLNVSTKDMNPGAGRITLGLLDQIGQFRSELMGLEAQGCLRPGEAAPLLTRMIETLALPSRVTYYLRHGTSVNEGFVDLLPPFRIKVVVPIHEEGKVAGFETAWYSLVARGRNRGHRLALEKVETFVGGKLKPQAKPSHAHVLPPESVSFYRLFFLTRRSPQDHDILLLAARDPQALQAHSVEIRSKGESVCSALQVRDVHCVKVPTNSAISAELQVKANGRLVYVPFGGNVNDALRTAGLRNTAEALPTLKIVRPYAKTLLPVEFDRARQDALQLVLIGGEEITW